MSAVRFTDLESIPAVFLRSIARLNRAMLFLALFGAGITHAQAEYLIKFSHVVSADTPKGKTAQFFADQVNQRLAGQVRVEVYPDSTLYDDTTVLSALRLAGADSGIMAAPSLSKFTDFSSQLQLFDLPFLFPSIDAVHALQDSSLAPKILQPLRQRGIEGLAFWDNGMTVFSVRSDHPLRLPGEDFEDQCFRIQSSNVHEAIVKALGGRPRKLPFKMLGKALAQGIVDGQDNAWSNIRSHDVYRLQNHITVSKHTYLGYLVVVGAGFWNQLPEYIQQELREILVESVTYSRRLAAAAEQADRAAIADDGQVDILELSPEERALWKKATASVEREFAQKIGESLLEDVHLLINQQN